MRNLHPHVITCTLLTCLSITFMAFVQATAADRPMVRDAWIPEAPPATKMHAAYLTLMNPGSQPIELVGVESPQYGKAELHLSAIVGGVATMAKQDQVTIPAGGTVILKPGGFHVMLMMPKSRLVEGDAVDLTFRFGDGNTLEITATIRKATVAPYSAREHHKMN